jgi:hypothetical protein
MLLWCELWSDLKFYFFKEGSEKIFLSESRGEQKKPKNWENRKKNNWENRTEKKNRINRLKNHKKNPVRFRFSKSETDWTEPNRFNQATT